MAGTGCVGGGLGTSDRVTKVSNSREKMTCSKPRWDSVDELPAANVEAMAGDDSRREVAFELERPLRVPETDDERFIEEDPSFDDDAGAAERVRPLIFARRVESGSGEPEKEGASSDLLLSIVATEAPDIRRVRFRARMMSKSSAVVLAPPETGFDACKT